MALSDLFEEILETYVGARANTPFGDNNAVATAFVTVGQVFNESRPVQARQTLIVKHSYGRGNWAYVPWIAFLDSRETKTTQEGVYAVYLFCEDMSGVYLTFNQGVTAVLNQHGRIKGAQVLQERAVALRTFFEDGSAVRFSLDNRIDLRTSHHLGENYEHSTVAYKLYERGAIPPDQPLLEDLEAVLAAYDRYLTSPDRQSIGVKKPVDEEPARKVWGVYVPKSAEHNFAIGCRERVWGSNRSPGDLRAGDKLVMVFDISSVQAPAPKGYPRVPNAAAFEGNARSILRGTISTDLFESEDGIWPDDIYPHRFCFEQMTLEHQVPFTVADFGEETVDAVRRSACTQGLPQSAAPMGSAESPEGSPKPLPTNDIEVDIFEEALDQVFMPRDILEETLAVWLAKKNVILQGPPGTGKTFLARRLAAALTGSRDAKRISMVQFHQSYAYEDFIQGYRPGSGGFERKDGLFYSFCKSAKQELNRRYVFIIDEINRGHLSKIFGEAMLLIESDKRGPKWAVPLTYSWAAVETFYVPTNVFLLGLMNTADRSLAVVDYALRRRFAFVNIESQVESDAFVSFLVHWLRNQPDTTCLVLCESSSRGPGRSLDSGHGHVRTVYHVA